MSASTTSTIANLSILMGARRPQFTQQGTAIAAANSPPASVNAGVALDDSIYAALALELAGGANDVDFKLWGLPYGRTAWCVINGADALNTATNWMERVTVAGLDRLYVEVTSINAGTVSVYIGPCINENLL